jgi:ankyrin repeat protein
VLDEDASRANAFGDDGFHPLGLACFFGHVDAARLLLEHGADPNLRQGRGFRAIDAARLNGDERVEQLLVQYGADR